VIELSNGPLEAMRKQMPQTNQKKLETCAEFVSGVACLIAEGSEFMTKEQFYDATKNAFNRVILKQEERND
jgi:hypothetical protein